MAKTASPSRKEIERFWRNMALVNEGGGFETEEEKQSCKASVKAMYAFAGAQIRSGTVWNWGLDMEEIDDRVEELMPSYKHAGTDGFSEQLYFFALHATGIPDFSDSKLLDVGCGFGDGLNFISRAARFRDVVGLDLCQEAINYANSHSARHGLAFVCGDAENMPFDDNEMDLIINVESSHTYPDFSRFLSEVNRVLRPGGCFSFVDVYTEERYSKLAEVKAKSGLRWVKETDITAHVKSAILKRLQPNSVLRRTLQSKQPRKFGFHKLMEPFVLVNYGADFVGHEYTFMQRLFRKAVTQLLLRSVSSSEIKMTRYVHNLALKG